MAVVLKVLCGAALALASDPTEWDSMRFVQYPLVHKITCDEGSGTGFRVGLNHWYSVAHVTTMHNCAVDGAKISITEQDGLKDFSRFDTERGAPNGYRVDCEGFIPGHWYYAVGHAKGLPFQTLLAVYATIAKDGQGKRVLIGEYDFIPGMSGGPVLNSDGEVVGLVNAYVPGTPISLSRELKSTSVCGADIA